MAFKYKGLRLKDPSLMKKLRQVPLTFTRASVAYDYKGDAVGVDTPRFQHLINGVMEYGCLIEEAHTNILPASQSQSLSEAYTTAALNGTYTFQCEGSGSYELSGGATGTVSKDNPVTAAISSATVTLTPTGTSTLNQIVNLGYSLSWTLGGTTQAGETLTAPTSVFNLDHATFEIDLLVTPRVTVTGKRAYILHTTSDPASGHVNEVSLYFLNAWTFDMRNVNGNTITNYANNLTPNTWQHFAFDFDSATRINSIGGVIKGTDNSPNVPLTKGTVLNIGCMNGNNSWLNGIIKNFMITGIKRAEFDMTRRAVETSQVIDKEIRLIAPLKRDLKAYRVRT